MVLASSSLLSASLQYEDLRPIDAIGDVIAPKNKKITNHDHPVVCNLPHVPFFMRVPWPSVAASWVVLVHPAAAGSRDHAPEE